MFLYYYDTLKTLDDKIDASNYKFLIIYSRNNKIKEFIDITHNTLIEKYNVKNENIIQYAVPHLYLTLYSINHIINASKMEGASFDAIICISSSYNDSIKVDALRCNLNPISHCFLKLSMKIDIPIIYDIYHSDIYNMNDEKQAIIWADAAIEMADFHSIKRMYITYFILYYIYIYIYI